MQIRFFAARLVYAVIAIASLATAGEAALVTFVASDGNDANVCTAISAPCQTLARAYNVTAANGTIRVLSPVQGNLTIGRSITIEGVNASVVGQITVASSSASVTLRGLSLNGAGQYANGISITSADEVHVENCTVEHYTGSGISFVATTATHLDVSNTVLHDNGGRSLLVSDTNAWVNVENSRFEQRLELSAYRASVTRSVVSGGIAIFDGAANITETVSNDSLQGVWVRSGGVAILTSSVMSGSDSGLLIESGASAEITNCVFALNNVGINNFGTVYTRKNNTLNWNVNDYKGSGTKIQAPAF
jgi:hypothetical protein